MYNNRILNFIIIIIIYTIFLHNILFIYEYFCYVFKVFKVDSLAIFGWKSTQKQSSCHFEPDTVFGTFSYRCLISLVHFNVHSFMPTTLLYEFV